MTNLQNKEPITVVFHHTSNPASRKHTVRLNIRDPYAISPNKAFHYSAQILYNEWQWRYLSSESRIYQRAIRLAWTILQEQVYGSFGPLVASIKDIS